MWRARRGSRSTTLDIDQLVDVQQRLDQIAEAITRSHSEGD